MKTRLTSLLAFAFALGISAAKPVRAQTINRFHHFRCPTPIDKQNVVRMDGDTR